MKVVFDHTQPIARNIISFYFKPERKVRYTAGQFVELTLPHPDADKRGQRRWFTLSSSPSEDLLTITTKFPDAQTSTFKQTLKSLKPHQEVLMSDPMGDFVLPKDKSIPLVFVAGGIGVTPMRSMIKWLTDESEQRDIHLIYAANSSQEVAFSDIFKDYTKLKTTLVLSEASPGWKGETGRLDANRILQLAPDAGNTMYYISGPEPMVEGLVDGLKKAGIKSSRLVGDYFPNYTNNV